MSGLKGILVKLRSRFLRKQQDQHLIRSTRCAFLRRTAVEFLWWSITVIFTHAIIMLTAIIWLALLPKAQSPDFWIVKNRRVSDWLNPLQCPVIALMAR